MSVSADPKDTAAVEFASVTGKTATVRVRFLTSSERRRLQKIIDERIDTKTPDEPGVMDAAKEAIEIGVVGTTFEQLQDIFTDRELCLVACRYRYALDISEIELGKFTSRRQSAADTSAESAAVPVATSPASAAP